jgi:hypothetical protein
MSRISEEFPKANNNNNINNNNINNNNNNLLCSKSMMEDVRVKLNLGLPWRKLRSTGGRLSLPANWT